MVAERAVQRSVVALRRPRCAQMFFVYPGRGAGLRGNGLTFLTMMRKAGLGDRNLALVADPYCDNYSRGVSPDIADLPSLVDWHRNLLKQYAHVTEVYHLGNSSGGYGALLFGHLLGARKVWAFAPRTARLRTADTAKAFLKEQLSTGGQTTEFTVFYSPANRRDCAFAELLAPCPGVVLAPYTLPAPDRAAGGKESTMSVESYHHRWVLPTLVASGEFGRLMPPFVAAPDGGEADAS